jgi:hypothetical protein
LPAEPHRIGRLQVCLATPDLDRALGLRTRAEDLAFTLIPRVLERVFDALAPGDATIRLDRLRLDLGTVAGASLERDTLAALERELTRALRTAIGTPPAPSAQMDAAPLDRFIVWLTSGVVPLRTAGEAFDPAADLERLLRESPAALIAALRPRLGEGPGLDRLVLHATDQGLASLLVALAPGGAAATPSTVNPDRVNNATRLALWRRALRPPPRDTEETVPPPAEPSGASELTETPASAAPNATAPLFDEAPGAPGGSTAMPLADAHDLPGEIAALSRLLLDHAAARDILAMLVPDQLETALARVEALMADGADRRSASERVIEAVLANAPLGQAGAGSAASGKDDDAATPGGRPPAELSGSIPPPGVRDESPPGSDMTRRVGDAPGAGGFNAPADVTSSHAVALPAVPRGPATEAERGSGTAALGGSGAGRTGTARPAPRLGDALDPGAAVSTPASGRAGPAAMELPAMAPSEAPAAASLPAVPPVATASPEPMRTGKVGGATPGSSAGSDADAPGRDDSAGSDADVPGQDGSTGSDTDAPGRDGSAGPSARITAAARPGIGGGASPFGTAPMEDGRFDRDAGAAADMPALETPAPGRAAEPLANAGPDGLADGPPIPAATGSEAGLRAGPLDWLSGAGADVPLAPLDATGSQLLASLAEAGDPALDRILTRGVRLPRLRARWIGGLPEDVLHRLLVRLVPVGGAILATALRLLAAASEPRPGSAVPRPVSLAAAFDVVAALPPGAPADARTVVTRLAHHASGGDRVQSIALLRRAGELATTAGDSEALALLAPSVGAAPAFPPPPERTVAMPPKGQTIYIGNAGLVLFNPYLPALFDRLNLLSEGEDGRRRVRGLRAATRAVHLLQYLVDGRVDQPEPDLALNKILAGLAPAEPVAPSLEATPAELALCDGLIAAVIGNWPILSGSSPAALRETFLRREGRLFRDGDHWTLLVQRKGVDVLRDQLPWSISVVYQGWMRDPIHVTW